MTEVQLDRMKTLYVYWQTVDAGTVDLDRWFCGTHACLAGHAASIPEFQEEGFQRAGGHSRLRPTLTYNDHLGTLAVLEFFGVYGDVFCARNASHYDEEILDRLTSSESDWVNNWTLANERMRQYLREEGVDPDSLS